MENGLKQILSNKEFYRIGGRYTLHEDILYLGYSASYLEFSFCGKKLSAEMISDGFPEDEALRARVAVFVNDEEEPRNRIKLEKGTALYDLCELETEEPVTIRIMKYSEAAFASVGIVDVILHGGTIGALTKKNRLKMEFIGDSITCGYGIEADNEMIPFNTATENPWEAYACRTARLLDADYQLISWSGDGIITHYIDESVNEVRTEKPLMPELYRYTDEELADRLLIQPEIWTNKEPMDIVVINLGTNDASYTRTIPEREAQFKPEYKKFLHQVREANREAAIVVVFGIMDGRLNDVIRDTVIECQAEDHRLFYYESPQQDLADGLGSDFHPSKVTHKKVADGLSRFIREKLIDDKGAIS